MVKMSKRDRALAGLALAVAASPTASSSAFVTRHQHPLRESMKSFVAASSPSASKSDENVVSAALVSSTRASEGAEQTRRDILAVSGHILASAAAAVALSAYEDYDCAHLKPSRATLRPSWPNNPTDGEGALPIWGSATRGMGWGEADRSPDLYAARFGDEQAGRAIPSYNEVMLRHRMERVPMWRGAGVPAAVDELAVRASSLALCDAIRALASLKTQAKDYDWDGMAVALTAPVLTSDLELATSVLRSARNYLDDDARRDVVGFDWGSCAWRHCGAAADSQEALAELRNSLGMFEPYECLFALDIVERSLRDMLAVVPKSLRPSGVEGELAPYVPYESRADADGYEYDEDSDSALLTAMTSLRNNLFGRGE